MDGLCLTPAECSQPSGLTFMPWAPSRRDMASLPSSPSLVLLPRDVRCWLPRLGLGLGLESLASTSDHRGGFLMRPNLHMLRVH